MSGHVPVSPTYNITKSQNRQASDKEPATEIKSTTAVRPKDPVDPRKQDGVVCKILCECGKVYWPNRKVRARSTIGIYGFHELRLRPFLNTQIRPVIIRSGTKLSLLPETLTGILVELRRLST